MKLGGVTITIINDVNQNDPTGFDGCGDPIYGDPTFTVVTGCDIQQHRTSRDINVTDLIVSRDRLFAPASAPLLPTSMVAVGSFSSLPLPDGTVHYLVDGEPAVWRSHTGMVHHLECYLREQVG